MLCESDKGDPPYTNQGHWLKSRDRQLHVYLNSSYFVKKNSLQAADSCVIVWVWVWVPIWFPSKSLNGTSCYFHQKGSRQWKGSGAVFIDLPDALDIHKLFRFIEKTVPLWRISNMGLNSLLIIYSSASRSFNFMVCVLNQIQLTQEFLKEVSLNPSA